MWGSFRGLKDQVESVSKNVTKPGGVSTFISRIGEAVAPTSVNSSDEGSEDNEYYEEDEDYYEGDEEEDDGYEDEETMEYFVEEEGESNSINNQLSSDDNEDGELQPKKLPPPEAFSSLIARAFDQLEEEENYKVIHDNPNYTINESLTTNDDDGLSQEDAALEQISKNIRTEIEITSSNSDVVVTMPSQEGPPEIIGLRTTGEKRDKNSMVKDSLDVYLEEDINHSTSFHVAETITDLSHGNISEPLQGDLSALQHCHANITDQNLRFETLLNSQEDNCVSSEAEDDLMKEELLDNKNVFISNNVEPHKGLVGDTTHEKSLQEYEKTKATDKSDLKSTSFPNTETECKNDKKAEAADQTAVRNTSVVEDYDDLNDSLLNDEEQDISDTSLDRPAILAQSINYIRQLEENLNREKSLSSTLQVELANLKNQFECHKQQTDDRLRQQGQALKQCSEEAKVVNKEKARLEILLKERQALHEEENQRQRMQYQRLLEESKRSLNHGEQKLEEKMGEIQQLQKVISDMRSNMRATAERARDADQIIKELTCERDELEKELHEELDIKASLEEELEEIKRATGKVGGLQVIADDNRCRS